MAQFAFSTPQEQQIDDAIFGERVYVLYGTTALGQAVNVAIALAIAILAWGNADPVHILAWLGAVLVVALARIFLRAAFVRAAPDAASILPWYRRFFAGTIAAGALWGTAGALFFVADNPASQTVLLMILAGLAAGAVPILAAAKEIYFVYCLLTLVPLGVMMGIHNELGMQVVALLDGVFIIAMLAVAHRYHESLTNALRLGFENEMRARQVIAEMGRAESLNSDLKGEVAVRRREQERLARAKDAAEADARVKSRILTDLSHELREPLHGIVSLANLALTENLSPTAHAYVSKMLALARSLSGTVSGLLDAADIESGRLEVEKTRMRLQDVLENVSDIYGTVAAEKGLSLRIVCDPGLPRYVIGDPVRIGQILNNFVGNAIGFSENGSVVVDARAISRVEQKVNVSFSVRDTAASLTRREQQMAFEALNRNDPATGEVHNAASLGLTLCRHLAKALGGRIGVDGEPGQGNRFWVELPLEVAADQGPEAEAPEAGETDLRGLNVLVADNDRITQLVVRTLLERQGATVVIAPDGREALNIALDPATALDAVLIDVDAPYVDGPAFTRKVRDKIGAGDLAIFAMTDQPFPFDAEECARLGLDGCLNKPLSPNSLLQVMARVTQVRETRAARTG